MTTLPSQHLPFRTEPAVLDPSMYLQHANMDPALWAMSDMTRSGQACRTLLKEKAQAKGKGYERLSPREVMLLIYHPDERVALDLLDFHPDDLAGWHHYIDPDLEGARMGELTSFVGRNFWDEAGLPPKFHWEKTREDSQEVFRINMWIRLWRRVLDGLESENLYWSPLMDRFPRADRVFNRFHHRPGWKKVQKVTRAVDQKLQQLGEWAREEADPEQLERLTHFQSSRLQKGLLEHKVPLSRTLAEHLLQHIRQKDIGDALAAGEPEEQTLQNLFLSLHEHRDWGSPFFRKNIYRRIAGRENAGPSTWKLMIEKLFQAHDEGERSYTEGWKADDAVGLFQISEGLQDPEIKQAYFQTAPAGEIKGMVNRNLGEVDQYLPGLIQHYPEWVAKQLARGKQNGIPKIFQDWLEQHPEIDLSPLLQTSYPEARRTVIRVIARQSGDTASRTDPGPLSRKR